MGAPCGGIHPSAVIGQPAEHREHRELLGGTAPAFPFVYDLSGIEIHETALLEALVTVDAGVFRKTTIGPRTWLLKKAHVGHDCVIGADCELASGCVIGGECQLGDGVKIGLGAVLRPRVSVGAGARIGAGAVVIKDVPAGETWAGNPAKQLGANTTDAEKLLLDRIYELEREIGYLHATIAAGETVETTEGVLEQWRAAGPMYLAAKELLPLVHRLPVAGVSELELARLKATEARLTEAMERYHSGFGAAPQPLPEAKVAALAAQAASGDVP